MKEVKNLLSDVRVGGDSSNILPAIPDNNVDIILTDPPYDLTKEQQQFYLDHFLRISKGWVILFCNPENQWPGIPSQYLFWVKPISTKNTSRSYSRFIEMIMIYGNGYWDNSRHWSQYTNVFNDLVDDKVHIYRKPPSMMERLIRNHTKPGDLILDPFSGSGVIADIAGRLGRNCVSIEISQEGEQCATTS